MKRLLYKEFKLASHPTIFIFLCLSAMLLIPSYPYYLAFFYTCLGIFFVFLTGRETKDIYFTVALPIKKSDAVKARCLMIGIIELAQVLIAIPFAVIGVIINPNAGGNLTGIEGNPAFFGLALVMLAIFNIIFIPKFYKTAWKVGKAFFAAITLACVYAIIAEVLVQAVPILKTKLDTVDHAYFRLQYAILAVGIVIYFVLFFLAYKRAKNNFEKVDL